jgi:hypothetical protein
MCTPIGKQDLLILAGGTPLVSKNPYKTWKPWRASRVAGKDVTAIQTPSGFGPGIPTLLGFSNGSIKLIK